MKMKDKSLLQIIQNHPEYLKLKKNFQDHAGKAKGKKNKYGKKAFNHLNKAIKRLQQLEETRNEFIANQDNR